MTKLEKAIGRTMDVINNHRTFDMNNDDDRNTVYYIYDCLRTLHRILDLKDCNECRDRNCCPIRPDYGQIVRYNCAFFKEKTDENN